MPFIGRDWRAPGETWVRVKTPHTNGWERSKLRPIQISESIAIPGAICQSSSDDEIPSSLDEGRFSLSDDSVSEEEWVPHCFVKSKSKEFIGCTSMSEAFHRLDIARAVTDIRRFNYVCKVVSILVEEKLRNLSATARKSLLNILTAMVMRACDADLDVSTARTLLSAFSDGLDSHVCGCPQLTARHQEAAGSLLDAVSSTRPRSIPDSDDSSSVTFLDLPREVLSLVLRRLPDSNSLLESAKAHAVLEAIVAGEDRLWQRLCFFHFTEAQMKGRPVLASWRDSFFHLKKFHGLKEVYADVVEICCQCKALFWKNLGHPCVRPGCPSVRVTPRQFVDMLLFL